MRARVRARLDLDAMRPVVSSRLDKALEVAFDLDGRDTLQPESCYELTKRLDCAAVC